jgi:hypothetical protein
MEIWGGQRIRGDGMPYDADFCRQMRASDRKKEDS